MFTTTGLKLRYFCQKNEKFSSAGGFLSPLQISGYPPDIRLQLGTKTRAMKVPCRHFLLKFQKQGITISRKKENIKIRKSMLTMN